MQGSRIRRCCTSSASGFDGVAHNGILTLGDSKTVATYPNSWGATLTSALNVATSPTADWTRTDIAVSGQTAEWFADNIASVLSPVTTGQSHVLFNMGVNSFGAAEADYKADVLTIADAIHARWPAAVIYMMRPWKRGFDATADTHAGWINDLVASRTFIELGPDERSWLKGADDGVTMTTDGIHYSAAGQAECADQWQTTLGY